MKKSNLIISISVVLTILLCGYLYNENTNYSLTANFGNIPNVTTSTQNKNEKTVYIGKTGTKYHNAGCRTLKGNDIPITLSEALADGREPCKVCH